MRTEPKTVKREAWRELVMNDGVDYTFAKQDGFTFTISTPPNKWELAPTGDFKAMTIALPTAPNFFNRWMQQLAFGFKWRKL